VQIFHNIQQRRKNSCQISSTVTGRTTATTGFSTPRSSTSPSVTRTRRPPGKDQIHVELHKHLGPKMRKLFLAIVNSTWITQAPVKWNDTDLVAVLKPDKNQTCPSSYRPIAPTSSSGKDSRNKYKQFKCKNISVKETHHGPNMD
jgi:hypothetical protein